MFFDLNVPVPSLSIASKKGRGKQPQASAYTPAQSAASTGSDLSIAWTFSAAVPCGRFKVTNDR